jgi:F-type H+-transporting ATPase subunit gamma
MAGTKEIRLKIRSVESTRKITRAMQMVAASKMRRSQERMHAARPYAEKIRNIAARISHANPEYRHPFVLAREPVKRVGIVAVSTDKGLCGGLNVNAMRLALQQMRECEKQNVGVDVCALGGRALGFMQRLGANVLSYVTDLGDRPSMETLLGALKVMLDAYLNGQIDRLLIVYTRFINTMKQEPVAEQLLPLAGDKLASPAGVWDYIYEPQAQAVLDTAMTRYIETLIHQALAENMASEQAARMVAMKAASDNAGDVINELTLLYNKNRQMAITREIAEIVGGAAAV